MSARVRGFEGDMGEGKSITRVHYKVNNFLQNKLFAKPFVAFTLCVYKEHLT